MRLLRVIRGWFPVSRGTGYSVVVLFLVSIALNAANLFWTSHQVNATSGRFAAQQAAMARADASARVALQRGEAATIVKAVGNSDRQWCTSLGIITRFPVPRPARPRRNPVGEATWELDRSLIQLERNYHCKE